jgi:hypothetical protein
MLLLSIVSRYNVDRYIGTRTMHPARRIVKRSLPIASRAAESGRTMPKWIVPESS